MQPIFTGEDTWKGGFYEVAMNYGPRAENLLDAGLKAIWRHPNLEGVFLRSDVEPTDQARTVPSLKSQLDAGHLRGIAILPNERRVACGTFVVREDEGDDWLGLYLPLGALHVVYPVGAFPFDEATPSREWREPLEKWLAEIGRSVFAEAPFRIGLIGFEVSGFECPESLQDSPDSTERQIGYLLPSAYKLEWYPTNQWQAQAKPVS